MSLLVDLILSNRHCLPEKPPWYTTNGSNLLQITSFNIFPIIYRRHMALDEDGLSKTGSSTLRATR